MEYTPRKVKPFKTVLQLAQSTVVAKMLKAQREEIKQDKERKANTCQVKIDDVCKSFLEKMKDELLPDTLTDQTDRLEAEKKMDYVTKEINDLKRAFEITKLIVKYNPERVSIAYTAIKSMLTTFDFAHSASVSNADSSHLTQRYGDDYKKLAKVNLLFHTIHVYKNAVEKIAPNGHLKVQNASEMLLACLLHDFGKSSKVQELLKTYSSKQLPTSHPSLSAMYVNLALFRQLDEMFERLAAKNNVQRKYKDDFEAIMREIADLVEQHHISSDNSKFNAQIEFIKSCDHEARRDELNRIGKGEGVSSAIDVELESQLT